MSVATSRYDSDDVIDVRDIVTNLWRRKWMVASSVVVFTAAFTIAALTMTPIYRASVVLVDASTENVSGDLSSALSQLGGLASIVGLTTSGNGTDIEEALAVLRSRRLVSSFIEENGLMPILYPKLWDASSGKWRSDVKPPTAEKAHRLFSRMVTQIRDRESGLVTVQVDWKDGTAAAAWANALVARVNDEMRARAISQADAMVDYLEAELTTTSVVETRQAINSLVEAQVKQRMLASVTREYSFRVLDPAVAPDIDSPVRPRRRLMVAVGAGIGLFAGVVAALALSFFAGDFRRHTHGTTSS
jgi:uncharacterized protein involved in exopolysaccharide biosynthesis